MPPILAIVIPCFNEEEVLPVTSRRINSIVQDLVQANKLSADSYLLMVDDGSRDRTWELINELHTADAHFRGLKLSRNFGHQYALLAGLNYVPDADIVISIDADLQDDPEKIREMVDSYAAGYDVVYGVRSSRKVDSPLKRLTAKLFYTTMSSLSTESVYNHADFRLLSRRALDALLQFKDANLYLRGMVPMVGFPHTTAVYEREERFAGTSKYSIRKLISLAWSGVTNLSTKPLRFVTICGFAVFLLTLILTTYAIVSFFWGKRVPGWASTVIPIYFLGGIQLLCIGLIGEYLAKIYKEVKDRPRFVVDKFLK